MGSIPVLPVVWSSLTSKAHGQASAAVHAVRRLRPSDPSWPTAASWEKLKQQVGGNLIPVSSPLAPCTNAPGSAACTARAEEMKNPYFIGEQAGGAQTSGWLEGWTSAPSAYAVVARSTEDVVAAVNFARDNNLRLVVKGGGHSYQGTSNAADSLLIWTREMHDITLHDAFVPEGWADTAPRPAVTIEAGARCMPTYNAVTTKAGRYVQGGGCATVGHKAALAITAAENELRAITPAAGAYLSESNFFDHAWQTSFWGPNYPRLVEVKKKYDPAGLFFVHHGVGSEEWSADGFTKLAGS